LNKYDFTTLVKNPSSIGEADADKLRELVKAYPYFSLARNLLVKSLHKSKHYEYDTFLKQAALLSGNRSVLYNLVHDLPLNTDSSAALEERVESLDISSVSDVFPDTIIEKIPEPIAEIIPEPIVELVPEPVVEIIPEPIVEVTPAPEVKEVIEIASTVVDTTGIKEDEKLVRPTGDFVKYKSPFEVSEIPKLDGESLIGNIDEEEDVLGGFDISSLNELGSWKPAAPIYIETKTPEPEPIAPVIPEPVVSITPEPIEEIVEAPVVDLVQEELIKEEVIAPKAPIIEPEVAAIDAQTPSNKEEVKVQEDDFFTWLNEKSGEKSNEESAPVKNPAEDVAFVDSFTQTFAAKANQVLSEEIHIAGIEKVAEQIEEPNLLRSLEQYEVDIFLAPIYRKAIFDAQLFDTTFGQIFPDSGRPIPKPKPVKVEVLAPKIEIAKEKVEIAVEMPAPSFDYQSILEVPKVQREPQLVESILEKFIRENPSIARPKSEFYNPVNMAKQSAESDSELVSETLAAIYLRQGLLKKAIGMYEKLGLLYPDKLAYFAGLIQKVKNENNLD